MKVLKVYLLIILFIFVFAFNLDSQELQKSDGKEKTLTLIEALNNGEVSSVKIESLGTDQVKLIIEGKEGLKIEVPKGKINLGFIKDGKIRTKGWRTYTVYSPEEIQMKHYLQIGSDDLEKSEGLSLIMNEALIISIPQDKKREFLVKGYVEINVPIGFTGFPLAGVSGIITTGVNYQKIGIKHERPPEQGT